MTLVRDSSLEGLLVSSASSVCKLVSSIRSSASDRDIFGGGGGGSGWCDVDTGDGGDDCLFVEWIYFLKRSGIDACVLRV